LDNAVLWSRTLYKLSWLGICKLFELGGNFFEDFFIGQRFEHATPRTISEGDQSLYIALTGARQPLPSSAPLAQAQGFRDRPIDDILVFNMGFGKTVPDISTNAIANLGYADVRFLDPVFAHDTCTQLQRSSDCERHPTAPPGSFTFAPLLLTKTTERC
jgi:acyl dehydratase